jgi:hypothetical protein
MVQHLVVVMIFILPTHQTQIIIVMLILAIVIQMASTIQVVTLNLIKSFQVVLLIILVLYSIKFTW